MTQVSWQQLSTSLKMAELGASASEAHGIVCGLICGGINLEDGSWYAAFNDLMNDGIALPIDLKTMLQQVFDNSCNEFVAQDYQVKLLLMDDEQSINQRAKSLAQWSESFLAGFAIGNESGKKLSDDVKEAINDLSQISRLDAEIEDDEASQHSLEELIEYVRVSAMLCFAELGQKPQAEKNDKKLH